MFSRRSVVQVRDGLREAEAYETKMRKGKDKSGGDMGMNKKSKSSTASMEL